MSKKPKKELQKETYQGECLYCGQTQIIETTSQDVADEIATVRCICEAGKKFRGARQCKENIERICGEEANNFGMEIVDVDLTETITDLGQRCFYHDIEAASIRLKDSIISIKKTKEGTSISRKKVSLVKLEV